MAEEKLWWISWYQPTEDERPLTFPPNEAILGWWNSGSRCSDNAHTICAVVRAETEEEAKAAVRKDWPEAEDWRFCGETGGLPGNRFPLGEWMTPRFEAIGLVGKKS